MTINRLCIPSAILVLASAAAAQAPPASPASSAELTEALGLSFPADSQSTVLLKRDGKQYLIDVANRTVRELSLPSPQISATTPGSDQHAAAAALFAKNCAACHGAAGNGIQGIGTPNFHSLAVQHSISDQGIRDTIHNGKSGGRMPAWSSKLTDAQIAGLASYIRSFAPGDGGAQTGQPSNEQNHPKIYEPGDDVLVSLPTGRPTDRHGVYVNFAHRFAYDPAFTGTGRGEILFGLDGFAIPSFGFRYGVTDKLSVSIYRSPSIVGRPIQLMAGYNILDEHKGQPLNMEVRVSIEGQNNFRKNYTENIEGIFSRSITSRAQFYLVPTLSFNDRPLVQSGFLSSQIVDLPGTNAFSLGAGLAVDIRPTVALLAEVIPTIVNGSDLGIHRPAYSFGIQKKIWRHAFTFGFSTSPGTTVSQRAGTRAEFLGDPSADTPGGLFIGFDLTRQIH